MKPHKSSFTLVSLSKGCLHESSQSQRYWFIYCCFIMQPHDKEKLLELLGKNKSSTSQKNNSSSATFTNNNNTTQSMQNPQTSSKIDPQALLSLLNKINEHRLQNCPSHPALSNSSSSPISIPISNKQSIQNPHNNLNHNNNYNYNHSSSFIIFYIKFKRKLSNHRIEIPTSKQWSIS